ncbi:hypothetical protein FH508_0002190 [Lysinibacillus sp. CD3-6]|uniref:hypothetical protein n=1 Tax=Lysinibacillus sp. CD3-6 TaxID=2892541 RepID=UPI00116A2ED7|nr:hypothetical protein [Lysinibacillus sp. CD3-6]UED80725.1 hypothetical protein FH508_0002190 [Lysinibacillus sp. CD3-6]
MKKFIPIVIATLFISNSTLLSDIVNAEENTNNSTTEKQYEYSLKYNYEEIYALLKLSEEEFNLYWQQGLSIAEMATKQGIDRSVLEEYFVTFHHKVLREWQIRDEVPEPLYFTQVYRLKDEINEFIDRNPNKDQAQN